MVWHLVLCLVGFGLLYYGAEWLVRGASDLARGLGVTPIVIGLTIVAFGTSAPEMVVSALSAFKGKSMIAVGNVIGSNICNIALVLGLSAVFQPIRCHPSVVKRNLPIMLGTSIYLLLLSLNSHLGRLEGATLFGGIIIYSYYNYLVIKKHKLQNRNNVLDDLKEIDIAAVATEVHTSRAKQLFLITAGIIGVVGGAELVVDSAVDIMTILGVSEKFIGLTIVSFGTSLPELATSLVAALRKEMDISIGNLVGSNVFNMLSVLGVAALIRPIDIPGGFIKSGLIYDYLVMLGISFLPWLMLRKRNRVGRRDGLLLLATYIVYLAYLMITA